ncbi:hypothetical protein FN846DRAFT_653865 [Sphaerosporella brunnea]|uniref:RGS domain-containing protein n=1 Tax=Sphaerosporella brunnea TaxID=1250544 RepID=A0A5J5EZW6_9PEZI|nr:hypothetical protein FN846DRAFT_653865 [Sphaerosporella brunnea]
MVYNVFSYRRPNFVSRLPSSNASQCESEYALQGLSESGSGLSNGNISGIPDALSFDRIIEGSTCPPMTCRDFMSYLIYVEHCAENLQFYLWYKDYVQRFEKLPEREKELSPEHKPKFAVEDHEEPLPAHTNATVTREVQRFVNNVFATHGSKTSGLKAPSPAWAPGGDSENTSPLFSPPNSMGHNSYCAITPFAYSGTVSLNDVNHKQVASETFEGVDVKWQPFSIQPFRDEISRIIAIYLAEGAPRELNLSSRDRQAVIKALARTTHPSALKHVKDHIEDLLRFQSHPNFIRWSICNGNKPRVAFAVGLGTFCILGGILSSLIVTLGSVGRGWRAFGAIGWLLGSATLFAAMKGMCVVLHGRHRRHVRPWELWNDDAEMKGSKDSFETSSSTNSYEDEPWVEQYEKRSLISRIFDKEVWIEEPALRQVQDTIAVQSIICAAFFTGVLTAIFMVVPAGNFY